MKYLFIGAFVLFFTILISRIFLALGFFDLDTFTSKTDILQNETNKVKLEKMGKQNYKVFCSSCHGMDGKGNKDKAHNHTKRMAKKQIIYVIKNGANNFTSIYPQGMPAGLVNESDAEIIADYMVNKMKGKIPKAWNVCTSCHGVNGEGISYIAPNIKIYSNELVSTVLNNGKKGVIGTMPYFGEKLSELQMKSLATYIRSIQK